uniref:Reverse transcriptase zinc-binding domain-containing protein n=1 Tax=Salix viminalis TaxID=40686 RepID=A0A6N2KYB2_SALVM
MVDGGGNWKWEVFAHLLPMQVVMGIAGYIPPRQDALEDTMIWDKSVNGRFTVKTAYMVREEDETIERDPIWRIIWKWKGMERIRMFIWTVAHNAIMTNEMRWRRRISDNKCCSDCVNEVENLTHALRDCPKARKIWEVFLKVEERELFFSQNWYTWLVSNLSSRDRSGNHGDWNMVFDIAMWYIWKERCSRTLGGNQGNWEANCVADWLANFGLSRDLLDRGSDIITEPPSGIYTLLYYDLIGSTILRLI